MVGGGVCLSPPFSHRPPSMEGEFGTLGDPEKWVVEVPLQPLAWVGLAAIYCRHLLTRQRISLALIELVRGVSR